jgi:phospholipid transport system substrate-binding protein
MKFDQNFFKKLFLLFAGFALLSSSPSFTYASEITDGLKKTIDEMLIILRGKEWQGEDKKAERRKLLKKIIAKKFSYYEMSRRTLAEHWKKRTPKEKKEFIETFGKLLESAYARKIESFSDEKILYGEEKVRKNVALVKTIIEKNGEEQIPVNYKLVRTGNDWMIYDFVVEGVSLIKNYRSQFNRIIHRSSFQELIVKMNKKVDKLSDKNL